MSPLGKLLSMREMQPRTKSCDLGQRRPLDKAFSGENRASHPRMERHNQKGCDHRDGEQGWLDGMRKVHDTNVAVVLTRFGPYQQTYSQWIGGVGLHYTMILRKLTQHPERPCALPTDPSWGTVV